MPTDAFYDGAIVRCCLLQLYIASWLNQWSIDLQSADITLNNGTQVQAWLRSRGEEKGSLFTAEAVAEQFGVTAYQAAPLPPATSCEVVVKGPGRLPDILEVAPQQLPPVLEWGCVLVEWR